MSKQKEGQLSMLPNTKPKKQQERNIFNVKAIKEKKYNPMVLDEYYKNIMGEVDSKFTGTLYGGSGAGKSVFALQFANWFANNIGKALYNSHEEAVNKTIQDRVNQWNIDAPKLYFGNKLDYETMCKKIVANKYRLVIIDSVKYMDFTADQLYDFNYRFRKRSICLLMVAFGTGIGSTDGAKDHLHASDVKLYFTKGKIHSHGRYISAPKNITLFKPTVEEVNLFGKANS
jgi:predicted ATP-dependent serine protease